LKKTRVAASLSNPAEVITGVFRANGRIRSAAARTSAALIAKSMVLGLAQV